MIKSEAKKLIDTLPDNATWDDLIYQFYVRKKIELATEDLHAGRLTSHEEVKKRATAK